MRFAKVLNRVAKRQKEKTQKARKAASQKNRIEKKRRIHQRIIDAAFKTKRRKIPPLKDRVIEPAPDIGSLQSVKDDGETYLMKCNAAHAELMLYLQGKGPKNYLKLRKLMREAGLLYNKNGLIGRTYVGVSSRIG
jgi:hypothetical protein